MCECVYLPSSRPAKKSISACPLGGQSCVRSRPKHNRISMFPTVIGIFRPEMFASRLASCGANCELCIQCSRFLQNLGSRQGKRCPPPNPYLAVPYDPDHQGRLTHDVLVPMASRRLPRSNAALSCSSFRYEQQCGFQTSLYSLSEVFMKGHSLLKIRRLFIVSTQSTWNVIATMKCSATLYVDTAVSGTWTAQFRCQNDGQDLTREAGGVRHCDE